MGITEVGAREEEGALAGTTKNQKCLEPPLLLQKTNVKPEDCGQNEPRGLRVLLLRSGGNIGRREALAGVKKGTEGDREREENGGKVTNQERKRETHSMAGESA